MQFARPEWLWLLAAIPALGLRASLARTRRSREWKALGQGGRPSGDGSVRAILALIGLVLALAQPRWGRTERPPLPPGHDVVIALDVSRSMAATDAVPDRLGVAKEAAAEFIARLGANGGERVALVAFAGRGVLRCPLTENLGAVLDILGNLRPGSVRPGGSDLGAALDAALDAFDDQDRDGGRTVVLLSDGEDLEGQWKPAVARLRARGIVVHAVAIGDAENGHTIPSERSKTAQSIRYQGEVVLSKRDDKTLEAIAQGTSGAFIPLGLARTDLGQLYTTRIASMETAHRRARLAPESRERSGVFLSAAFGLLLASCWSGRPRPSYMRRWSFGLGLGLLGFVAVGAVPVESASSAVTAGRAAFEAGRFDASFAHFQRALTLAPRSAIAHFDAASALYQLGRYEEALVRYENARTLAPASLRPKIDYVLGNTLVRLGQLENAILQYDKCLAASSLVHDAAAENRRYAEEQIRRSLSSPNDADPDSPDPKTPAPPRINPPHRIPTRKPPEVKLPTRTPVPETPRKKAREGRGVLVGKGKPPLLQVLPRTSSQRLWKTSATPNRNASARSPTTPTPATTARIGEPCSRGFPAPFSFCSRRSSSPPRSSV